MFAMATAAHLKPGAIAEGESFLANTATRVSRGRQAMLSAEKSSIASGVEDVVRTVTDHDPQVNAAGNLRYYFGGSTATNLIARAGRFTELSSEDLPKIVPVREVDLHPDAQDSLTHFIRKIKDVDHVYLEPGASRQDPHRLLYDDFPSTSWRAFKEPESGEEIRTDFFAHKPGVGDVVSVSLGDRDVFVSHPASSLSWKTVYSLDTFSDTSNFSITKSRGDFEHLLDAALTMRTRTQLVHSTRTALDSFNYGGVNPYVPYDHAAYRGPMRTFVDDVLKTFPEWRYLEGLQVARERSIDFTRIMQPLHDSEKGAVIDFANRNPNLFDIKEVNRYSQTNMLAVADEVINKHPQELAILARKFDVSSTDSVAFALGHNDPVFFRVATQMPKSKLEWRQVRSRAMQVLSTLNPGYARNELLQMQKLLDNGMSMDQLEYVFNSKFGKDPAARAYLFHRLEPASRNLRGVELQALVHDVNVATRDYDPLPSIDKLDRVQRTFSTHLSSAGG
jgi:hypothetical protein